MSNNTTRTIKQIALEIVNDWKKPYFGAIPYVHAMMELDTIDSTYGQDSARSIVSYFLVNAKTWRGEKARSIKKELNALIKK